MRSRRAPLVGIVPALALAAGLGAVAATVPGPVAAQASRSAQQRLGITETAPGRLTIDVQGAEIRTLLRAFAEFSGRNIVVGKEVKGQVSVNLRDTPWRDALTSILRAHGLDFVEEAGGLRVDTNEKLQAELLARETNEARRLEVIPMETRILTLSYAKARELQPVVQGVLSKRGQVTVADGSNALVVTDIPERMAAAERMVVDLDTVTPQIEITAKLVDVDLASLRELGVRWSGTDVNLFKAPDTREDFDINAEASDPVLRFRVGTMTQIGDFEAELTALELRRKADIISNPRITTLDNREARILVGQKIPLIVQDVAGNAVTQLTTIGIQLQVTPHLTADGKIILDLHPEVSDLSTQSTVQGGVIINTSEADTRVMVDDGQTAVIGGLIRTNDSEVKTGVPILMHIPLLGALFSNTATVQQQRELVIFVTPRLVQSS